MSTILKGLLGLVTGNLPGGGGGGGWFGVCTSSDLC